MEEEKPKTIKERNFWKYCVSSRFFYSEENEQAHLWVAAIPSDINRAVSKLWKRRQSSHKLNLLPTESNSTDTSSVADPDPKSIIFAVPSFSPHTTFKCNWLLQFRKIVIKNYLSIFCFLVVLGLILNTWKVTINATVNACPPSSSEIMDLHAKLLINDAGM
jgi:hypothetical protein